MIGHIPILLKTSSELSSLVVPENLTEENYDFWPYRLGAEDPLITIDLENSMISGHGWMPMLKPSDDDGRTVIHPDLSWRFDWTIHPPGNIEITAERVIPDAPI